MRLIASVIALCSASWMSIYLYGLYADSSVKYNSALWFFPILLFSIVIFYIYLEVKNSEEISE